jgi:S-adenosylmethionine hydrolase
MVKTYGDAPKGSLVALIGSGELLEISLVEGNAAGALGVGIGETVEVRRR